jgi:HD-GYP domain-containing protein (c-di-GMP phosphodiesterase class II)
VDSPATLSQQRSRALLRFLAAPAKGTQLKALASHVRFQIRLTVTRYVAIVVIMGLALVTVPRTWNTEPQFWLPAFVTLTVVSTILEFVSVELPHEGVLSVATISHIATVLLVPAPFAAISVGTAVLLEQGWHRKSIVKVAFNTSNYLVTVSLGSMVVGLFGNPWVATLTQDHLPFIAMFVACGMVYYLSNDLMTSGIISLVTGRPVLHVFRANARNTFLAEVGAAAVGALFAVLWILDPFWSLLLTVPGAVISRALRYIRQLETETRSAVRVLAGAIDDRDASTFRHSERVAEYAVLIAKELDLSPETVDLIELAAEVHDLGKIGIPDRVLLKPGPLTQGEQTLMWLHTDIGAKMLSHFQLFRPGANIVRSHHENYDGTGYPRGLTGEAIPIGARVVAVADAFDAMTSDRPYRSALGSEEAVRRLRDGAGRQWDPVVIGAFLKLVGEGRVVVEGRATPVQVPESAHPEPDPPIHHVGLRDLGPSNAIAVDDADERTAGAPPVTVDQHAA